MLEFKSLEGDLKGYKYWTPYLPKEECKDFCVAPTDSRIIFGGKVEQFTMIKINPTNYLVIKRPPDEKSKTVDASEFLMFHLEQLRELREDEIKRFVNAKKYTDLNLTDGYLSIFKSDGKCKYDQSDRIALEKNLNDLLDGKKNSPTLKMVPSRTLHLPQPIDDQKKPSVPALSRNRSRSIGNRSNTTATGSGSSSATTSKSTTGESHKGPPEVEFNITLGGFQNYNYWATDELPIDGEIGKGKDNIVEIDRLNYLIVPSLSKLRTVGIELNSIPGTLGNSGLNLVRKAYSKLKGLGANTKACSFGTSNGYLRFFKSRGELIVKDEDLIIQNLLDIINSKIAAEEATISRLYQKIGNIFRLKDNCCQSFKAIYSPKAKKLYADACARYNSFAQTYLNSNIDDNNPNIEPREETSYYTELEERIDKVLSLLKNAQQLINQQ